MEDDVLLGRINHRDSVALGELYDRYGKLVYSLAFSVLRDNILAEEVTQDVFLTVWNKPGAFQAEKGSFSGWISRVTRNRAIDEYRRRKVRLDGRSLIWDETFINKFEESSLEPVIVSKQETSRLVQALKDLPVEQRNALELAYFQGLSQQEIANVLNEPLGTVKTRIRLGMQKLRAVMD